MLEENAKISCVICSLGVAICYLLGNASEFNDKSIAENKKYGKLLAFN
jgi:hypothetical protein